MKKTAFIAIAGLVTLTSPAAHAGGIYFGFSDYNYSPAPRYVVAPRPVYYTPAPVYYYPRVSYVNYGPHHGWQHCEWETHNHRGYPGEYRGYDRRYYR